MHPVGADALIRQRREREVEVDERQRSTLRERADQETEQRNPGVRLGVVRDRRDRRQDRHGAACAQLVDDRPQVRAERIERAAVAIVVGAVHDDRIARRDRIGFAIERARRAGERVGGGPATHRGNTRPSERRRASGIADIEVRERAAELTVRAEVVGSASEAVEKRISGGDRVATLANTLSCSAPAEAMAWMLATTSAVIGECTRPSG